MRRDPRLYIDDILDAISNIRDYTTGQSYEIFQQDRKTLDAVVRNLEIIGEAAGRLPDFLIATAPKIEWRKIVGLRNILIHEYFSVSIPVVWDVVQNKLGQLENACRELLEADVLGQKKRE
jgi:uncharacterized protein with HEPN domain